MTCFYYQLIKHMAVLALITGGLHICSLLALPIVFNFCPLHVFWSTAHKHSFLMSLSFSENLALLMFLSVCQMLITARWAARFIWHIAQTSASAWCLSLLWPCKCGYSYACDKFLCLHVTRSNVWAVHTTCTDWCCLLQVLTTPLLQGQWALAASQKIGIRLSMFDCMVYSTYALGVWQFADNNKFEEISVNGHLVELQNFLAGSKLTHCSVAPFYCYSRRNTAQHSGLFEFKMHTAIDSVPIQAQLQWPWASDDHWEILLSSAFFGSVCLTWTVWVLRCPDRFRSKWLVLVACLLYSLLHLLCMASTCCQWFV